MQHFTNTFQIKQFFAISIDNGFHEIKKKLYMYNPVRLSFSFVLFIFLYGRLCEFQLGEAAFIRTLINFLNVKISEEKLIENFKTFFKLKVDFYQCID